MNTSGRFAIVNLNSGRELFKQVNSLTESIGSAGYSDVLFMTKNLVAISNEFAVQVFDIDSFLFSVSATQGNGQTMATNGSELLVARDIAGSPSGRFAPVRVDFDGNTVLEMSYDTTLTASPSTVVPPFRWVRSCALDSTGASYFAGEPWPNSENDYGLIKLDADGNFEWGIDTHDGGSLAPYPCEFLHVDSFDNVYFVRHFRAGSVSRPILYKMDSGGSELWTMDFDYDTSPFTAWGMQQGKKPFVDETDGWMYFKQSEVNYPSYNTEKIRRYSLDTGMKDPDYDPYVWPDITEIRIHKKSGDIIAVPTVLGSNLIRYDADTGELRWVHDMSGGLAVSYNLDIWQD